MQGFAKAMDSVLGFIEWLQRCRESAPGSAPYPGEHELWDGRYHLDASLAYHKPFWRL